MNLGPKEMPFSSKTNPPSIFHRKQGGDIAYHQTPGQPLGVVFLPGFRSNMNGTKAMALERWCLEQGRAFVRFDYTGHGASSGNFVDGCIGDWAADVISVIDHLTTGPQVLIGSSMGGWLMFLAALARPKRIAGLLGLAAAPDFTEDLMGTDLTADQRGVLMKQGQVAISCDYAPDETYMITRKLIDDGKNHLLLRSPLNIQVPVRLIQGMLDTDVPWATALKVQDAMVTPDVEIQFVKRGDHRLSGAHDLLRLERTLGHLLTDIESP